MKSINILSLVQAYNSLEEQSFALYLRHYDIEIRDAELDDLKALVETLCDSTDNINIFNKFYVGYRIPQIGKEFDLLRFGRDFVINVELKKTSTEEKIRKQLSRNKYYLSYIGKQIYNLCYVSETQKMYFLKDDDTIRAFDVDSLQELLNDQIIDDQYSIDYLFNPSDYLVSPFNSTDRFLNDQYFLTHQQEEIAAKIFNQITSNMTTNFISVVGGAGTGKTLLVYDLVKNLKENNKKPLIIHCGYLNEGQDNLKSLGWKIIPIKALSAYDLSTYDVIIIDEAQRIYARQLDKIVEEITKGNGNCIFSYDKFQTLARWEERNDIDGKINQINPLTTYTLSEKIRTNKEIATFIKKLFNNRRNLSLKNKGNIEVNYFNNLNDAKSYLKSLDGQEWEVLRFTPSQYENEHHEKYSETSSKNSHKVIGQEFDGVVVVIDKYFTYNQDGELVYQGKAYYNPVKMLFQNITRARKKVNLVIIGNEELLSRYLSIFNS